MNRPPIKRRRYFVNRQIQGSLLWRLVCYWAVYHTVLWISMFLIVVWNSRINALNGQEYESLPDVYGRFVHQYFPMLIAALTVLPMLLHDCIRLSHRFAGPLVRFNDTLRQMQEGRLIDEVQLREGDLLSEFQGEFNRFLKYYNGQMRELAELRKHMEARLSEGHSSDSPSIDEPSPLDGSADREVYDEAMCHRNGKGMGELAVT